MPRRVSRVGVWLVMAAVICCFQLADLAGERQNAPGQ
jgi:hypothetical protein